MRARTPLQLAALVLLVLAVAVGITALALGDRTLGSPLIGVSVVSMATYMLWMRSTTLPTSTRQ
ncbi:hypothetical protein ACSMXN_20255 [Jatrophihabitans sp. DSM 45814]